MMLGDITCSVGAWVGGILYLTRSELGQVAGAGLVLRGESDGMGCILEPHSHGFPVCSVAIKSAFVGGFGCFLEK